MERNTISAAGTTGRLAFVGFALALTAVLLFGCSARYGRLQGDMDITRMFRNGEMLSDYQYYTAGFQRIPYGIIGIKSAYSLRSSYWQPIDLTPTVLNQVIYRMQTVYSIEPRGAWIVDPEGRRVGIWYSSQNWTKVKVDKDNQVMVVPPKPPDFSGLR
jgi:hypothetical protein